MQFNELKVGQRFKFSFEADGNWIYVKDDEKYFTEVCRPLKIPKKDFTRGLTFCIDEMKDETEVVPYDV